NLCYLTHYFDILDLHPLPTRRSSDLSNAATGTHAIGAMNFNRSKGMRCTKKIMTIPTNMCPKCLNNKPTIEPVPTTCTKLVLALKTGINENRAKSTTYAHIALSP